MFQGGRLCLELRGGSVSAKRPCDAIPKHYNCWSLNITACVSSSYGSGLVIAFYISVACCFQVEEVVTAFAPACKESGGIFEMTFSVSEPGRYPEVEAMISSSSLEAA